MSPAAEALYQSAMTLPEADRRELAEVLLDADLPEPPCPEPRGEAYLKEIQRRTRETDPSTYLTMEEFRAKVRERFGDLGAGDA
jgi:hypothetical protein